MCTKYIGSFKYPHVQPKRETNPCGWFFLFVGWVWNHDRRRRSGAWSATARSARRKEHDKGENKECWACALARAQDDYIFDWDFQIPPPQPKAKAVQWTAFSFLVAMKRTYGAWKMKQNFVLWNEPSAQVEVSLRFASWRQSRRFIEAARILLNIREANSSLTKLWIYDIIILTNNHKTSGLLAIFRYNVCYHPKGAQKW